ncbi:MAG TPA: hypothetical protein VKS22_04300 [Candidatus Binataceae bacterium]|nr:hypothetical protein [Candidatus Binataceae bacterium]
MLLALDLVEGVTFDRPLVEHCLTRSKGTIRLLLGVYAELERRALDAKIDALSLADAADLGFVDRAALPVRRGKDAKPETVQISISALTQRPIRSAVG